MRGSSHCFSVQCFVRGTVSLNMHLITTFIRKITVSAVETKHYSIHNRLQNIHLSNKFAILKTTILIGFFLHVQDECAILKVTLTCYTVDLQKIVYSKFYKFTENLLLRFFNFANIECQLYT